jgi:putative addiction module killer protein
MPFETRHYVTEEGRDVLLDWFTRLRDPLAKIQILKRVNRIEQENFGDHKFCHAGVWELRIDVGAGYRVYYAQSGKQTILLLGGGDKQSQQRDIERAVWNWQDWQRRSNDERPGAR